MHTSRVGGRRAIQHAHWAIATATLLLASAAAAPSVVAESELESDAGIDILSTSAGTFTFAGTAAGEPLSGNFGVSGEEGILVGHPGAIDIDSSAGDGITFRAIDACADRGTIDIVGLDMPRDFILDVVDSRTGAKQTYERTGGTSGINLIHPGALPCSSGEGSRFPIASSGTPSASWSPATGASASARSSSGP